MSLVNGKTYQVEGIHLPIGPHPFKSSSTEDHYSNSQIQVFQSNFKYSILFNRTGSGQIRFGMSPKMCVSNYFKIDKVKIE